MKWLLRLWCSLRKHVPEEFVVSEGPPIVKGVRCARCGHVREMCDWCKERVGTMYCHTGEKREIICRECSGVDVL